MTQAQQVLEAGAVSAARELGWASSLGRALDPWKRRPLGLFGAVLIVCVVLMAVVAPLIAPHKPKQFAGDPLEAPSRRFPLGTNNLGQDVLSRTIFGAQVSIAVGLTATLLAVTAGTVLGIVSGYLGGWVDMLIQRGMEVLAAFPGLTLALILVAALGRPKESGSDVFVLAWQLRSLEMAVTLPFIFGNMRVIRSAVLVERAIAYVEAARTIGATPIRILARHILPNTLPLVIVLCTNVVGIAILIEASLSFLGFGVSPGTPSWGIDLANRNREYFLRAPWLIVGPATALSLTVLGFNYFGDALRDILDPRLRGGR